jgi:hypothetical protein
MDSESLASQPLLDTAAHPTLVFMSQRAVEAIDFKPLNINRFMLWVVLNGQVTTGLAHQEVVHGL